MLHKKRESKEEEIQETICEDKKNMRKGYAAAIAFSVLVGFSFLAIKVCQKDAESLEVLCYRYDFAFVLAVILAVVGVLKTDMRNRSKEAKLKLFFASLCYVVFMALQVVGLMFATSIEGAILFAIIPIIVKIIAAFFLKEKSTVKETGFVCLTVAALIVMISMGSSDITVSPLGIILLILSSISMAFSNVLTRYAREDYKPMDITVTVIIMGFVVFNIAQVIIGIIKDYTIDDYFIPLSKPSVFISGVYLGAGCILASNYLMNYMLSKMEAVKATIFGNVSTAISIVAGVVILGEPLMWYHILCTALIILGVVGLSMSGRRN